MSRKSRLSIGVESICRQVNYHIKYDVHCVDRRLFTIGFSLKYLNYLLSVTYATRYCINTDLNSVNRRACSSQFFVDDCRRKCKIGLFRCTLREDSSYATSSKHHKLLKSVHFATATFVRLLCRCGPFVFVARRTAILMCEQKTKDSLSNLS